MRRAYSERWSGSTRNWLPVKPVVLNLERAPFNLPSPVEVLVEGCEEEGGAFADKALGVWRAEDLPG